MTDEEFDIRILFPATVFLGVAKSHALTMELQMGNRLVQSFSLTIA